MPVSQGDGKHRDSLPHELCNAPRGNISRYITLDISFHHDQLCREWVLIQLLQSNHPFGNLEQIVVWKRPPSFYLFTSKRCLEQVYRYLFA